MPGSVSGAFGIFLFVLLLAPGFTYVRVRERDTPERRHSIFRDTLGVGIAAILANSAGLAVLALVRSIWASWTPDIGRLILNDRQYLATAYPLVALWLALIVGGGALAAWGIAAARRKAKTHPSQGSAWRLLFDHWYAQEASEERVKVACALDDGSYVEGVLGSWSDLADDAPDRDLVLVEPLMHRYATETEAQPYGASVAVVSASKIQAMFVTPLEERPATTSTPASGHAEEEPQASAAEASPPAAGPSAPAPAATAGEEVENQYSETRRSPIQVDQASAAGDVGAEASHIGRQSIGTP